MEEKKPLVIDARTVGDVAVMLDEEASHDDRDGAPTPGGEERDSAPTPGGDEYDVDDG